MSSSESSSTLQFPAVIAAYIAGANAADSEAVAACFTLDAVVMDEGQERRGIAAIVAWKEETTEKYTPQTTVLTSQNMPGKSVVTASVSGTFPGSPVVLRYLFTLDGEKIARLGIAA
jgi:hypothetical protein